MAVYCEGLTKKRLPCNNIVKSGRFCYLHRDNDHETERKLFFKDISGASEIKKTKDTKDVQSVKSVGETKEARESKEIKVKDPKLDVKIHDIKRDDSWPIKKRKPINWEERFPKRPIHYDESLEYTPSHALANSSWQMRPMFVRMCLVDDTIHPDERIKMFSLPYENIQEKKFCPCSGCSWEIEQYDQLTQESSKNFANRHHLQCRCKSCVCDKRKQYGQFEDHVKPLH